VQILTGYPQSYPPDRVTYFKGIVGSVTPGLNWVQTKAGKLDKSYGDAKLPENVSLVEAVLYEFITRRFIRSSIIYKTKDDGIYIYKKDSYEDVGFEDRANPSKKQDIELKSKEMTAKGDNDKWGKLDLVKNDGRMSFEDANKFGVICAVSQKVRDLTEATIRTFGAPKGKPFNVPTTPYNGGLFETLGGQITNIEQHFPFLRHFTLMDGSYFFYHVSETDEDLYKDPYIKVNAKEKALPLPAIYDMTPSGTRSIRCPFISFLSPGMTVLFQSRFTKSTFVGYFYAPKTNAFLVIISNVSFATVQEDNMMELMCVDMPNREVWIDENTGEIRVKEEEKKTAPAQAQGLRNKKWCKEEKTVVQHLKPNATETFSRWINIVDQLIGTFQSTPKPSRKYALEKVISWNKQKVDVWMQRSDKRHGISVENTGDGIGAETKIKVPWLLKGDIVTLYYPLQDEYPPEDEVKDRSEVV